MLRRSAKDPGSSYRQLVAILLVSGVLMFSMFVWAFFRLNEMG